MTLLSFIAITASLLAYIVWVLSKGMSWIISTESTSAWKRILRKAILWFDLEEAPLWRRILLKVLLSILILTSLGCGFWSIVSIAPENRTIWRILLGILMTAFSFIVIIGICAVAHNFTDALSFDYFNLRDSQKSYTSQNRKIIAINSTILFLWVVIFVGGICLGNDGQIFAWLSLSVILTAILYLVLFMLGFIVFWIFYGIIIYPIRSYIKWLIK